MIRARSLSGLIRCFVITFVTTAFCVGNSTGTAADSSTASPGNLRTATDLNPDPDILEIELVGRQLPVDLTGDGLIARVYTFNGLTPGPELRAKVGNLVIVHFTNELPEPINIHWHGIEVDNANDGTNVTQNPIEPGGKFTYRFRVTRPGVFMYHSHVMPTNPEFKGFYGPIVVEEDAEEILITRGVLPDRANEWTLVLADTTVCKTKGTNDEVTFEPHHDTAWVFTHKGLGNFPGNTSYPTPRDLCEDPRDDLGKPLGTGPLAAGDIPNIQPPLDCLNQKSCRVNEGQLVLTNGRVAAARDGNPRQPGPVASGAKFIDVTAQGGLRLRLLNPAVSRYFRLIMTDGRGSQIMLYQVGGQSGLLDRARIKGGMLGKINTQFDPGEILMAPGMRTDIVANIPDGEIGDVLTLWTQDYQQYGTTEYPLSYGGVPTVAVAHFRVAAVAPSEERYRIAEGTPLRVHPDVDDPVETVKGHSITAHLLDPRQFDSPLPGSASELMLFAIVGMRESIDGVHGLPLMGLGVSDYRDIPHIWSSRYAVVGDLLELTFRNGTQMHHPLHHHGFSFQPVRILDPDGELLYEFEDNEWVDTLDIPATNQLVYRIRLDDRPRIIDGSPGGAAGRWLFHCHILDHAELGMMAELVVLKEHP